MTPGDIGEFGTEGEKAFYKFLEGVAKPHAHDLFVGHWVIGSLCYDEPG